MRRSLVTVLFACTAASAGTVSISNTGFEISATVSRSADGPTLIQDQASISVDYSLLFIGGTGTGTFSPLIIDDGVLNESSFPDLWPLLGGNGFVTSPDTLSAGDPDPGSHPLPAQAFCSPTDGCPFQPRDWPFTEGIR